MAELNPEPAPRARRWIFFLTIIVLLMVYIPVVRRAFHPPGTTVAATTASTPVVTPPVEQPLKLALGGRLFSDPRLSGDRERRCSACHDLNTNGASRRAHDVALDGSELALNTPTLFNVGFNLRFGWTSRFATLESQIDWLLEDPRFMGLGSVAAAARLAADPQEVAAFRAVYGHGPDAQSLLDALASFARSLVTPDSRFDRWLRGEQSALSAQELAGYVLFKTVGCIQCHRGVNFGGDLLVRQGVVHPAAGARPSYVRVPGLRNVVTTGPYFHDGGIASLTTAIRGTRLAQKDAALTDAQIEQIVAFLGTLTGVYAGRPVASGNGVPR
jgi:cytochrome c peroxidase